jgi:hypothetical protein
MRDFLSQYKIKFKNDIIIPVKKVFNNESSYNKYGFPGLHIWL